MPSPDFGDPIDHGDESWDEDLNDKFAILKDGPWPVYIHTGDESDLESTFPAADHDHCIVWVDDTVLGRVLYHSDGSSWEPYGGAQMAFQADASGWADSTAQSAFNALLAKLRATGRMAPS